jgi:hypothetical protein
MAAYYLTNEQGKGLLDVERWDHPTTVVAITLLQDPNVAVSPQCVENADFIASSRALVPLLCDALERVLGERAALADVLRSLLARLSLSGASVETDQSVDRAQRLLAELEDN